MILEFIFIYTQYQNGIAKRFNRIIVIIARFMLIQFGLSLSFWVEVVVYVCYLYNKMLYEVRGSESSDEL